MILKPACRQAGSKIFSYEAFATSTGFFDFVDLAGLLLPNEP